MNYTKFLSFSLVFFLYSFVGFALVYAQGGTAAPFLLMNPSGISRGMGNTGASTEESDHFSMYNNPALLGITSSKWELGSAFFPGKAEFNQFNNPGLFALSIVGKYNLKTDESSLPLSIGVSYLNQSIDLGEFTRTGEDGHVIGKFKSTEFANTLSAGAILDYGVKFGAGFSYKHVNSNLSPVDDIRSFNGSGDAIDFGLFCKYPFLEKFDLENGLLADFSATLGAVINNLGSSMIYSGESDPLPRNSVLSYSINAGLHANMLRSRYRLLNITWSAETMDLLIKRDSLGYNYLTPYSTIRPIDNLILLKSSSLAEVKHGIRFSILDVFDYCMGYFNAVGYTEGNTSAFGIKSDGLFRFLNSYHHGDFTEFLDKHISVSFYKASSDGFSIRDLSIINITYKN